MASVSEALLAALDHQDQGRIVEAETLYRRILDAAPATVDAWHLLGLLLAQSGRLAEAEPLLRRAVALAPDRPDCSGNVAKLLMALGRSGEVVWLCQAVALIAPDRLEPWMPEILQQAGQRRLEDGDPRAACRLLSLAAVATPDAGVVQAQLAVALQRLGRDDEAEDCYRAALGCGFDTPDLRGNLADILFARGRSWQRGGGHAEALALFGEAWRLIAGQLQAVEENRARDLFLFIGVSWHAVSAYENAARAFANAVTLDPGHPAALDSAARAWLDCRVRERGTRALMWRWTLDPTNVDLCLGAARALERAREPGEAAEWYARAARLSGDPGHEASAILSLNLTNTPAAVITAAARRWADRHAEPLTRAAPPPVARSSAGRPLRVGYLCESFLTHDFTCLPLVEHHSVDFTTAVYSLGNDDGNALLARYAAAAGLFRRAHGLDNAALADVIRADAIDILVDGAGFSSHSGRLLTMARRPAPLQIHFPVMTTTGLSAMDAVLVDGTTVPVGRDADFSEQVMRLPIGYHYSPLAPTPDVAREPPVAKTGRVTFGSFNALSKLSAATLEAWASILQRLPTARLIVKALDVTVSDQRALSRALGPQLEVRGPTASVDEHMAAFNGIDVHLDSFPYGGVTTTAQALWMGVPVVTLAGDRVLDRYGASLLRAVSLEDLATRSLADYVETAVALAEDVGRLHALRGGLRARMRASPLSDPVQFTKDVEGAYHALWRRMSGAAGS
jgi:protein O-GlcNAc transferase